MFTGIITAVGTVKKIEVKGADKRFTIDTGKLDLSGVTVGDSICVNGVCLTVVELEDNSFITDVSTETLSCTTFGLFEEGGKVNLERALKFNDRLSGHIVSGHVDGIGTIQHFYQDARSTRYEIEAPEPLRKYICKKGSICIDGVSLTVNDVNNTVFSVNIIPHTATETVFLNYGEGTKVNLEVDIIARYLETLMQASND